MLAVLPNDVEEPVERLNLVYGDLYHGQELGRGSTSIVGLVSSTSTGQRYALKTIGKAGVLKKGIMDHVFREKEALTSLKHPGIVRFFQTFKDERRLYFLLELLSGGDLRWHLNRSPGGRLPEEALRRVMGGLLLPLSYMQAQQLLYRDLKPANIMFTVHGRVKLIDFGHTKRLKDPEERSTSVCSPLEYRSPEAITLQTHGSASVLWSLGVLLVEAATGTPPFGKPGELTILELQERIVSGAPDLSLLSAEAAALAASLLQKSAEQRASTFTAGYVSVSETDWFAPIDWVALAAGGCVAELDYGAYASELRESDMMPRPDEQSMEVYDHTHTT